jgi:hypothetical protein
LSKTRTTSNLLDRFSVLVNLRTNVDKISNVIFWTIQLVHHSANKKKKENGGGKEQQQLTCIQ